MNMLALFVAYFLINIITLALETIVLSILLSKIFASFDKANVGKGNLKSLFMIFVSIFIMVRLGYFLRNILYDEIIPQFFEFIRIKLYDQIVDRYRVDYKELNTGYILFNFEHLPSSFRKLMTELLREYVPNILALIVCICSLLILHKQSNRKCSTYWYYYIYCSCCIDFK